MNEKNAQRLMAMLTQDFGMKAGSLFQPSHPDIETSWCVQGAISSGLKRAVEVAAAKGWLARNLNSWMVTDLGVASVQP